MARTKKKKKTPAAAAAAAATRKAARATSIAVMHAALQVAFGGAVPYTCEHCLERAYVAVRDGTNGYVTDQELLAASGGRLRAM